MSSAEFEREFAKFNQMPNQFAGLEREYATIQEATAAILVGNLAVAIFINPHLLACVLSWARQSIGQDKVITKYTEIWAKHGVLIKKFIENVHGSAPDNWMDTHLEKAIGYLKGTVNHEHHT